MSDKKYYAGIDVGFSGGISIIDNDSKIIETIPMPILKTKVKNKSKSEYDLKSIIKIFKKYEFRMVGLEIQQAFKMQGVVSMFKIGRGFGLLEGIISALGIPYTLIKPKIWQSTMFMGLPKDDSKTLSILVAERIWPEHDFRNSERCTNISDGLTDSSLMAEYIRREIV